MLKKMFKTILVLNLCIGVVLPTNAAVSVSDGSAFVTKAEFAADLNNLSNRMAQLENSLDAKIDSLVSSYLTRNGIWNGAAQDIEGYSVTYNGSNDPFPASITGINTLTTNLLTTQCNSNKAGMLVLQLNITLKRATTIAGWRPMIRMVVDGTTAANTISYRTTRSINVSISNTDGDILLDQSICTQDGIAIVGESVLIFPENATYNLYCFVSKDIFTVNVYDAWFSAVADFKIKGTSDIFFGEGTKGSMKISIASAKVY